MAIRVICADEPYICKDFAETNNILKIITDFSASVKKVRALQIHKKMKTLMAAVAVAGLLFISGGIIKHVMSLELGFN